MDSQAVKRRAAVTREDREEGETVAAPGKLSSWIRRIVVICFVIVFYAVFFYCFYAIFAQGFSPGPG